MRRLAAALLLALVLPGCSGVLGPGYTKPETAPPAAWRETVPVREGGADETWWKQFGDPVLDGLVRKAVAENLDLKVAAARVDQYLGVLDTTRSNYFPQVGAGAGVAVGNQYGRWNENFQGTLNASWELDIWGKYRRAEEGVKAQILASESGRRALLMTVVSGVAGGYVNLRSFDRQLEISRETEKVYAEGLRLLRLRFKYGTITQLDVAQAESQYETARQAIAINERNVRLQENLLSVLLGQPPSEIPRGKTFDELSVPAIPAGLPSTLLERRPDIIQAEQTLVAANAQVSVVRSAYFPTISLTGALGFVSRDLEKVFDHDSKYSSAGGGVTVPLLTFGAISGQVKQAEAVERQALHQYRQTVLSAFRETEDALVGVTKGKERADSLELQVKALDDCARLAHLQFDGGATSYLSVLDAERSLFERKLSLVQGRSDVVLSVIGVYKALGGGWGVEAEKEAAPPPAPPSSVPPEPSTARREAKKG
jgi:multidrug efflux system outer membrane protein